MIIFFNKHSKDLMITEGNEARHSEHIEPPAICCKFCGSCTHKHGYRKRWVNSCGKHFQIFAFRRRCSDCGATYTFLPKDLHCLTLVDRKSVWIALEERITLGRFPKKSKSFLCERTRRTLYKNFQRRSRLHTPERDKDAILTKLKGWLSHAASGKRLRILIHHDRKPVSQTYRNFPTILSDSTI